MLMLQRLVLVATVLVSVASAAFNKFNRDYNGLAIFYQHTSAVIGSIAEQTPDPVFRQRVFKMRNDTLTDIQKNKMTVSDFKEECKDLFEDVIPTYPQFPIVVVNNVAGNPVNLKAFVEAAPEFWSDFVFETLRGLASSQFNAKQLVPMVEAIQASVEKRIKARDSAFNINYALSSFYKDATKLNAVFVSTAFNSLDAYSAQASAAVYLADVVRSVLPNAQQTMQTPAPVPTQQTPVASTTTVATSSPAAQAVASPATQTPTPTAVSSVSSSAVSMPSCAFLASVLVLGLVVAA